MVEHKRWTKEEDKILVQAIKANPHNKAEAFRSVSKKLDRTEGAISYRWYNYLSNPESKYYIGCMFTMIGHSTRMNNRTISNKHTHINPTPIKKGIWGKIKKLLGL